MSSALKNSCGDEVHLSTPLLMLEASCSERSLNSVKYIAETGLVIVLDKLLYLPGSLSGTV